MVILCKAHMLISMICFAAQKTLEIVCAFQIGYRLNAWVDIHLSHSGCEVVVKAKDLCYIQRKVDINDAGFKFNNIWRHTKTFEDLICSSSLAGGLQQQSIYFTAVHILLSLKAFLGNFLILVVKIKVFIYTTGDCIDSFFVISGSTTDSKKIYVVVTCTLHHGFITIVIFFLFWQLIEW